LLFPIISCLSFQTLTLITVLLFHQLGALEQMCQSLSRDVAAAKFKTFQRETRELSDTVCRLAAQVSVHVRVCESLSFFSTFVRALYHITNYSLSTFFRDNLGKRAGAQPRGPHKPERSGGSSGGGCGDGACRS
jgi:hypothetical protein